MAQKSTHGKNRGDTRDMPTLDSYAPKIDKKYRISFGNRPEKYFARYRKPEIDLPNLVEIHLKSFADILNGGVEKIFKEFSPIKDYSEKKFEMEFVSVSVGEPQYNEYQAKEKMLSYEAPLRAKVRLCNKSINSVKEQDLFFSDFPLITSHGTFIINGVERVIVPQLARSFGVYFTAIDIRGKRYFGAKIVPARGSWIEFESDPDGALYARIDRKRKFPASSLLRIFGEENNESILENFKEHPRAMTLMQTTVQKDTAKNPSESYVEIYRRQRDGEMASVENSKEFVEAMFAPDRYDLSPVGRFHFNQRFNWSSGEESVKGGGSLTKKDLAAIIKQVATLNDTPGAIPDDIDHLGFRRIRVVGEMLEQKIRIGMMHMKRNIQNRMSTIEPDTTLPVSFINPRPLQARIKEFYATNQLSQFMLQENILAELEHLRMVSALGTGGLSRERAGFEVRDVHPSHYGRLCPIHTPEGPNIGLILRLATYARLNPFGMIETPYLKVVNGKIQKEVVYMTAFEEEKYKIAHAGTNRDEEGRILNERVEVRYKGKPTVVLAEETDLIEVATNQAYSAATSLIPFLNHDDAGRALMGSNMQKQATPCIIAHAPLVATGIEKKAAIDTGRIVLSNTEGAVRYVDARKIIVRDSKNKEYAYNLINFMRTNGFTALHQRPIVSVGEKVKKGAVLADASSSVEGHMALGQNVLVAFMSWSGYNFEDAIIISEKLVRENIFSSIHLEDFSCNVRDTKLGPEVTTHDIPNVGEMKLRNLDVEGVVRIGTEVRPGDILVGRITPKGESQLTPEERLLRSIFGEKARDVKDTSLRMDVGKRGRVVGVKVFSREHGDSLEPGIIKKIFVEVAEMRNISVGDKLAGRHGNKGVVSKILPEEDMPFMEDGTPVDIILTPLGVPSRMNLGQILELHLGLSAYKNGYRAIVPPFAGATSQEIREELEQSGFDASGKIKLYDGRTGEPFAKDSAIGYMYMMKLHHMVEDKIHMRSIGPYSLITQQPLGGRAQGGGQRFGEMEVWALLGYGSAYTLREMLTVKSDDILGRAAAFDAIVRGENIEHTNIPASFNVLLNNLRGLGLQVEMRKEEGKSEKSTDY